MFVVRSVRHYIRVRYSGLEYVKFEVYCSTHIESAYPKDKDKTNAEIAESFGCQIGYTTYNSITLGLGNGRSIQIQTQRLQYCRSLSY